MKPLRSVAGCLLGICLWSSMLLAIDVGQRVEFERAGQKFTGTVVSLRSGGTLVEVETEFRGESRKLIVPLRNVKALSDPPQTAKLRTWSDASGRFKIEAELVGQGAFDVKLRKQDGRVVTVPVDKLSVADQEYLATLDMGSENPFAGGVTDSGAVASTGASSSAGRTVGGRIVLPEAIALGGGQSVLLQPMAPFSNVQPDPTSIDLSEIGTAAMSVPATEGRQAMGRPYIIDPNGTRLCYTVRNGGNKAFPRVFAIDGKRRKAELVATIEGKNAWAGAANPVTGDVLCGVNGERGDKTHSLFVLTGVRDGAPQVVAHWKMFPNKPGEADYVRYRRVLSNKMAIVVYGGKVHAFHYGERRKVWMVPSQAFNEPAVSPGEKYTAIVVDNQCAILDTATGDQLASLDVGRVGAASIGFSPDAKRLAIADGTRVRVFDVATGEEVLVHEANIGLVMHGKPLIWLGDEFLLLPTGALLHLERNLIVWKYEVADDGIDPADLVDHGLFTFKGRGTMAVVRLPHQTAEDALKRDTSNITAVRSGDTVAIDVQGSGPGASAANLQQWLGNAATAAGYRRSPSAPTRLVASITRGKRRRIATMFLATRATRRSASHPTSVR